MRKSVLVLLCLYLSSCALSRRYTIPIDSQGNKLYENGWKIRFDLCATCSFLKIENNFIEVDEFKVSLHSSQIFMPWMFLIPIPIWSNCFASIPCENENIKTYHLNLEFQKNKTADQFKYNNIRLSRNGLDIPYRMEVDSSGGGNVDLVKIKIADWSKIGWGFDLDLRNITGYGKGPVIRLERYTTTTFGLIALD